MEKYNGCVCGGVCAGDLCWMIKYFWILDLIARRRGNASEP